MSTDGDLENLGATSDGVFAVDQSQRIILWNRGAEAILGYSAAEASGKNCAEILRGLTETGQASCVYDCPILAEARKGRFVSGENIQVRAKDGSSCWLGMTHIFLRLSNSHSSNSQPVIVHVFRDATQELEAKQLLEKIHGHMSRYGHTPGPEVPETSPDTALTRRETQVLELLGRGEGTTSIAKQLTISNTTARNHIQNILAKLGVHTRLEAVAYAQRHHLLDHPSPVESPSN